MKNKENLWSRSKRCMNLKSGGRMLEKERRVEKVSGATNIAGSLSADVECVSGLRI